MSETQTGSRNSSEKRHWRDRAVGVGLGVVTLGAGLILHNRDGTDPTSQESTQVIDSQPNQTIPQTIETMTPEEKEQAHRQEINTIAQNLAGRIANFRDQVPDWVMTEHNTAQVEVQVPSHTPDGQEAIFRFGAEVDVVNGQPDVTSPRQIQISMEDDDPEEPPLYTFELVKLSDSTPGGEWGFYSNGLAGTPAGHPDGTDQTVRVSTLEERTFENGRLENGNFFEEEWREEAKRLATAILDAAQEGAPVDPALAALG
jgi:hypothetical protein